MPGAPNRPPKIEATEPTGPTPPRAAWSGAWRPMPRRARIWTSGRGPRPPSSSCCSSAPRRTSPPATSSTASSSLDQLAVRFAEPRWPTMPMPFQRLRVEIPPRCRRTGTPISPSPPPEKERRRRLRRSAARAREGHGRSPPSAAVPPSDLAAEALDRAEASSPRAGPNETFWSRHRWVLDGRPQPGPDAASAPARRLPGRARPPSEDRVSRTPRAGAARRRRGRRVPRRGAAAPPRTATERSPLPDLEQRLAGVPAATRVRRPRRSRTTPARGLRAARAGRGRARALRVPARARRLRPDGDRGHPTPDDEEPVANRIDLVARLVEVAASEGSRSTTSAWAVRVARAAAYAPGDRPRAREPASGSSREVDERRAGRATGDLRNGGARRRGQRWRRPGSERSRSSRATATRRVGRGGPVEVHRGRGGRPVGAGRGRRRRDAGVGQRPIRPGGARPPRRRGERRRGRREAHARRSEEGRSGSSASSTRRAGRRRSPGRSASTGRATSSGRGTPARGTSCSRGRRRQRDGPRVRIDPGRLARDGSSRPSPPASAREATAAACSRRRC